MPVSCDVNDLAEASKCYCYGDKRVETSIIIYLLAQIAEDTSTPAELAAKAACYCFPNQRVAEAVQTYLLCAIAQASGA